MFDPKARRRAVSPRLTGGVVVAALFAGSTLLTPLYDIYRGLYGLSPLQLTLLYAVYVIGNLVALLFLGGLSDQRGRRPIVLAGAGLAVASALLFLIASGPPLLFAGRVVSGCAVGLGSGAATAWITEATQAQRRSQAASIMTAFNFLGLALGPLLAGVLAQYAPAPIRLPFVVYIGVLAAIAALAALTPETLAPNGRPPLSFRPRLGVPPGAGLAFAAPAAAGFIAMAVVGFYAALGPTMIRQTLGLENHALSAAIVAALFVVAAAAILATGGLKAQLVVRAGLAITPVGLGLLIIAQRAASLPGLLAASAVCGVAAALGYRGGLAAVNELAPPDRRAAAASSYFVCCFLGNALPIIGVGALTQAAGRGAAELVFAVVLSALAVAALLWAMALGRSGRAPEPLKAH